MMCKHITEIYILSLQYQERDTLYDQTYVETWKLYLNICLLYKI